MKYEKTFTVFFLVMLTLFVYGFDKEIKNVETANLRMSNAILPTAEYINENFSKDKKLCVYFDAGFIPYLTKLETLDLSGLLNGDLAKYEYKTKKTENDVLKIFLHRINYLFEYNPDIVVISSKEPVLKKDAFIEFLKRHPRWKEYKLIKSFGSDNYYELIFIKNE